MRPKNKGTNLFCLLFCFSQQTKQIRSFVFWENLRLANPAFGFFWPLQGKDFAQPQVPKFIRIKNSWGSPQTYKKMIQLLGYNFRKQRWKRQQPQAILTFFVYPKFLSFLLFPMGNFACCTCTSMVLYMSFDRFILAVDSRDLSQADKSFIRVSSFLILQNFNFWMTKFTVIPKTNI